MKDKDKNPLINNIRPEIMNEFVSIKPGALSRFGLVGIFTLILLLLFIARFIPYPESITFHSKVKENLANNKTHFFACEFQIPQKYYSKISKGMLVQIQIESYPFSEFGVVKSKIDSISVFANESGFTGYIFLPKTSITTQNKIVEFLSGVRAECIVITRNGNLFDRIYRKVTKEKHLI
jgi:hypothetical protein